GTLDEMRVVDEAAHVVVEAAGTGVGPVHDPRDPPQPLVLVRQGSYLADPVLQPHPVVEREIDRVEVRAAADVDGLVPGDAELHPDTLEEGLPELEHAGREVGTRRTVAGA